MSSRKLHPLEVLTFIGVAVLLVIGYVLFYTDKPEFSRYVAEDHTVEWFTVLGLLLGSFVSLGRFFRLFKRRSWWFLAVTFLLGLFLFFAAGEEISWGQRIFGIRSSEFFNQNNAQGETNLHNLQVNGVKLNKIIFTYGLGAAMALYLLVLPILYRKNAWWKNFLDRSAVPVARLHQIIAFALAIIAAQLIPDGKNAELLECGAALIFFLIVQFPLNRAVFRS